jgi:hypothetical protein
MGQIMQNIGGRRTTAVFTLQMKLSTADVAKKTRHSIAEK